MTRVFYGRHAGRLTRNKFNRGTLDKVNDILSRNGVWLHATKGFRRLNPKRTLVENYVANIKHGAKGYDINYLRSQLRAVTKGAN